MMGQPGYHQRHNRTRFYIFMITLIIGGLFFLLFLNNDGEGFSITNAIIRNIDPAGEDITAGEDAGGIDLGSFTTEKDLEKNTRIFPFFLSFDNVPDMKSGAVIETLELNFRDLTTAIAVNNDLLELNNLEQVNLLINNFAGEIEFKEDILSLSGTAKRIEANKIAFSSENEIKLSFEGLDYESLQISNIELKNLVFNKGNGELKIGEKLSYSLEEDDLNILYFKGNIGINNNIDSSSILEAEGNARGINVGGELLNLNLR